MLDVALAYVREQAEGMREPTSRKLGSAHTARTAGGDTFTSNDSAKFNACRPADIGEFPSGRNVTN